MYMKFHLHFVEIARNVPFYSNFRIYSLPVLGWVSSCIQDCGGQGENDTGRKNFLATLELLRYASGLLSYIRLD